ncbi:gamma-glutamyl-gamma-aminobutyrate hydrolase [Oceanisphaera psychrotolerans]|uniref:gamma-glutamyl-gamma-aminobutyrate hydrolase n=1 Tax=Oceanisphaera psychrotolerans TaxID=1414654 RepID=A0A1J4QHA0_9GAMM|nr:gamma-glutamyl-gamma-aminobutyrate hydrolase [Oceanisphaera psychrotolerans]OIN12244.1 gamma-glutamyl-gamma-aminobutyrate hydrolase [Oceanisphaera psychrotolerans]
MVDIFNKPVVGVIMCRQQLGPHPAMTLQEKYLKALLEAGALPFPLAHGLVEDEQCLTQALDLCDGLLLTGSYSNMEPHHYGETGEEPHTDPGRDRLSLQLIAVARARQLPLLGICRGFQEMVVASGGSLHRRLHETGLFEEHREDKNLTLAEQYAPAHNLVPQAGGLLSRLVGTEVQRVNSLHMQGTRAVGDGARIEATAPDGLVEAISLLDHPFALGVQWHPEWQSRDNHLSRALFDGFIQACRHYRASQGEI